MAQHQSAAKVGLFVDVANLTCNGGFGARFDVLREFACRDGGEPLRLNAYVTFDPERGRDDIEYRERTFNFFSTLRDFEYKVIQKDVKWYRDESGERFGKANADLDMAVDALLQSENLDRVLLATGDGDFVQVVRALQNKGCRVEGLAFRNVSSALRREVDMYVSGYLVPNLLPMPGPADGPAWGEIGSRVRGVCYHHSGSSGYGFMRFMRRIAGGLWITDSRHPDSPYESVFFHDSQMPQDFNTDDLPSHDLVFEFELAESDRGGLQALHVARVPEGG